MSEPLRIRVRAPFGAFRWMQAGVYRATSPVMPHSAAWGFLLGLAGIEVRAEGTTTTLIREDAPSLELAVGVVTPAEVTVLYQQLHGYPVGADAGKQLKAGARGAKYQIAPVKREVLVGCDFVLAIRGGDARAITSIAEAADGKPPERRYGLPFAGDNNLLVDRIERADPAQEVTWYEQISDRTGPIAGSCRLTVAIDRADNSNTRTGLFAPAATPSVLPSETAWAWTPRVPS